MIKPLLLGTALAFTANTAAAGCLPNTDKSVAYCAGLLGMIYQNKGGQADAFLSNDCVESIAIPADERCGYAWPPQASLHGKPVWRAMKPGNGFIGTHYSKENRGKYSTRWQAVRN